MKKILISLFIALSFYISFIASTQEYALDFLVNLALKVSPKLKILNYKYESAKSRIEVNSNPTDPMLMMGLANLHTDTFLIKMILELQK